MGLAILSEFLGTLFLILLGNGVVASVSYKGMFANQSGKWIVIAMGWGFAVMIGVLISLALKGSAHLNPAVTIYAAVQSLIKPEVAVVWILMQLLGAICGQIILNVLNWKHMKETDVGVIKSAHCTSPAYANFGKNGAVAQNFGYELVGTMVLLAVILAFGKVGNLDKLGPLPVTFLVMSIGMSLGSSTGYAINPTRDFGPRLVFFITSRYILRNNQVPVGWSYCWVPILAPSLAGVIIGAFGLIGSASQIVNA